MVGLKYMNGRGLERDINWDSLLQAKLDKCSLCYQTPIHHFSLALIGLNARTFKGQVNLGA